jgi:hypothetical protein
VSLILGLDRRRVACQTGRYGSSRARMGSKRLRPTGR